MLDFPLKELVVFLTERTGPVFLTLLLHADIGHSSHIVAIGADSYLLIRVLELDMFLRKAAVSVIGLQLLVMFLELA